MVPKAAEKENSNVCAKSEGFDWWSQRTVTSSSRGLCGVRIKTACDWSSITHLRSRKVVTEKLEQSIRLLFENGNAPFLVWLLNSLSLQLFFVLLLLLLFFFLGLIA